MELDGSGESILVDGAATHDFNGMDSVVAACDENKTCIAGDEGQSKETSVRGDDNSVAHPQTLNSVTVSLTSTDNNSCRSDCCNETPKSDGEMEALSEKMSIVDKSESMMQEDNASEQDSDHNTSMDSTSKDNYLFSEQSSNKIKDTSSVVLPLTGECKSSEKESNAMKADIAQQSGGKNALKFISGDKKENAKPDGDMAAMLAVMCGMNEALVHLDRLKQGSKGACVVYEGRWLTPNEFQALSGRQTAKDWKRSIRHNGKTLKWLLKNGILSLDPPGCRCDKCGGTLTIDANSVMPLTKASQQQQQQQQQQLVHDSSVIGRDEKSVSSVVNNRISNNNIVNNSDIKKKKKHRPEKRLNDAESVDERRLKKLKTAEEKSSPLKKISPLGGDTFPNFPDGIVNDIIKVNSANMAESHVTAKVGHVEFVSDSDKSLTPLISHDKVNDDNKLASPVHRAVLESVNDVINGRRVDTTNDVNCRRSSEKSPRCVGRKENEEEGETRVRRGEGAEGEEQSCSRTSGQRKDNLKRKSTSLSSPSHPLSQSTTNGDRSTNQNTTDYSRDYYHSRSEEHREKRSMENSSSRRHSDSDRRVDNDKRHNDSDKRNDNERRSDNERRGECRIDSERRGEGRTDSEKRVSDGDKRNDSERRADDSADEIAMWRKWFPWLTATTAGITVPHRVPAGLPAVPSTSGPFSHAPGERAYCTQCTSVPWLAHCTCYCAYFPHYPSLSNRSPTGLSPPIPFSASLYNFPPAPPSISSTLPFDSSGGQQCSLQDAYRTGYPWSLAGAAAYAGLLPSLASHPSPFDLFSGVALGDTHRASSPLSSSLPHSSPYKPPSIGLDAVFGKRLSLERPLDLSQRRF